MKNGGTLSAAITAIPAEYPALLKEVYKRADIAKPRSGIGQVKNLPVESMGKLLLADVKVNQGAMQAVSLQRGVAVKKYLAFKELLLNRLFLGATKSGNVSASGLKIDPAPHAKTDTPTGREMDATRRAQHRHATALTQICQNPA